MWPPGGGRSAGAFAHPLVGAEFSAALRLLRGRKPRLAYVPPLLASAAATWTRRAWIAKTRAAAAEVPDDWHLSTPPVFIVGFWRSGTTLLHELMSREPAFAAPTLADVICPADAPYLLAGKREQIGRLLPADRGFDDVHLAPERPQEEEWALAHLGAPSFFSAFYFPQERAPLIEEALFFDRGAPDARGRWRRAHERFLRVLALKYPGRRLVLKNPANSTRLADLRAMYPEASFLRIDRDPAAVLPSLRRMMDGLSALLSLQGAPPPFGEDEAAALHARVIGALDLGWAAIPEARRREIAYERLVAAPIETVEQACSALGLPLSEDGRRRRRRFWTMRGSKRRAFSEGIPATVAGAGPG